MIPTDLPRSLETDPFVRCHLCGDACHEHDTEERGWRFEPSKSTPPRWICRPCASER